MDESQHRSDAGIESRLQRAERPLRRRGGVRQFINQVSSNCLHKSGLEKPTRYGNAAWAARLGLSGEPIDEANASDRNAMLAVGDSYECR